MGRCFRLPRLRFRRRCNSAASVMDFFKKLASNLLDDQEHFTDLTQVAVVDAESCISVLSKRFETDAVYTHCGPLLVALNPYKRMPELYSEERLEEYAELLPADGPPAPHAFEMAARAYTKMMAQARARRSYRPTAVGASVPG